MLDHKWGSANTWSIKNLQVAEESLVSTSCGAYRVAQDTIFKNRDNKRKRKFYFIFKKKSL